MAEGIPGRILVTGPMCRITLRSGKSGSTESQCFTTMRFSEIMISADVKQRVFIPEIGSGAPIVKTKIIAPEVLAPIGLEPIDSQIIQQVRPLVQPPIA